MILKNKQIRETLNITLPEFKIRFAKEIKIAFESYIHTELAKPYFKICFNFQKNLFQLVLSAHYTVKQNKNLFSYL